MIVLSYRRCHHVELTSSHTTQKVGSLIKDSTVLTSERPLGQDGKHASGACVVQVLPRDVIVTRLPALMHSNSQDNRLQTVLRRQTTPGAWVKRRYRRFRCCPGCNTEIVLRLGRLLVKPITCLYCCSIPHDKLNELLFKVLWFRTEILIPSISFFLGAFCYNLKGKTCFKKRRID